VKSKTLGHCISDFPGFEETRFWCRNRQSLSRFPAKCIEAFPAADAAALANGESSVRGCLVPSVLFLHKSMCSFFRVWILLLFVLMMKWKNKTSSVAKQTTGQSEMNERGEGK
jgi:hypothetical protein